jgi:hypothetical protein
VIPKYEYHMSTKESNWIENIIYKNGSLELWLIYSHISDELIYSHITSPGH